MNDMRRYFCGRGLPRSQIPTQTIVQPTIQPTKSGHPIINRRAWARPFVKAAAAMPNAEMEANSRRKLN